jgi:DNA-binding NtrC family response regulator
MALKLLITHADEMFRRNLSERMKSESLRIFEASHGDEASDILQRGPVDVVLLGKVGLKENRLALLKRLKGMRPLVEVILLTAPEEHSFKGAVEAMEFGAFDDILLPVDIQTLSNRVREAFKRKKERMKKSSPEKTPD